MRDISLRRNLLTCGIDYRALQVGKIDIFTCPMRIDGDMVIDQSESEIFISAAASSKGAKGDTEGQHLVKHRLQLFGPRTTTKSLSKPDSKRLTCM